jgi:hypothetical protein
MKPISISRDLEPAVTRLNRLTNSPQGAYSPAANGEWRANIGCYYLHQAYGGVCLHRMVGEAGGCTDVLGSGHVTKRDLYQRLHAYIRGIEEGMLKCLT